MHATRGQRRQAPPGPQQVVEVLQVAMLASAGADCIPPSSLQLGYSIASGSGARSRAREAIEAAQQEGGQKKHVLNDALNR